MSTPQFQHLRCELNQGVLVITLTVLRMQSDELADALRHELFAALDHYQVNRVILDFHTVKYLASSGFRPLLSLHKRLKTANGALRFIGLAPEVQEVFQITRLLSSSRTTVAPFESAPDLATAVAQLTAVPAS